MCYNKSSGHADCNRSTERENLMYRDSSSGGGASVIAFIVFAIIVILWMPVA